MDYSYLLVLKAITLRFCLIKILYYCSAMCHIWLSQRITRKSRLKTCIPLWVINDHSRTVLRRILEKIDFTDLLSLRAGVKLFTGKLTLLEPVFALFMWLRVIFGTMIFPKEMWGVVMHDNCAMATNKLKTERLSVISFCMQKTVIYITRFRMPNFWRRWNQYADNWEHFPMLKVYSIWEKCFPVCMMN